MADELLRRLEIAKALEQHLERLCHLIKAPHDKINVARTMLALGELADSLEAQDGLLTDMGDPIRVKGHSGEVKQFMYFFNGASTFLGHFRDMEREIYHWGESNWGHNQKYHSKFQSAANHFRSFVVLARATLTDREYRTCMNEVLREKQRQELAGWDEQERLASEASKRLRDGLLAGFAEEESSGRDTPQNPIPEEHRTKAMSQAKASRKYFRDVDYSPDHQERDFRKLVSGGEITAFCLNAPKGRLFIFDKRQIESSGKDPA